MSLSLQVKLSVNDALAGCEFCICYSKPRIY